MDSPPQLLPSTSLSSFPTALQPTKHASILGATRRVASARQSRNSWNPTDTPRDRLTISQLFPVQRPGSAPPGVLFPTPVASIPGAAPNSHYTLRDMTISTSVTVRAPSAGPMSRSSSAGPALNRGSLNGSGYASPAASSPRLRSSYDDQLMFSESPNQLSMQHSFQSQGSATGNAPLGLTPPTPPVHADSLPTDPVASSLALELEVVRDRLAKQTEIATKAEAALQAAALRHQQQHVALHNAVEEIRVEISDLKRAKREMESETEVMRAERTQLKSDLRRVEEELSADSTALLLDRETLATTIRAHHNNEGSLEMEVSQLREENEHLHKKLTNVQRRLDEEVEVVEAVRGQLYEYKQMLGHLQQQAKRGKAQQSTTGAGMGMTPGGRGGAGGEDRPLSGGPSGPSQASQLGKPMVMSRASSARTGAPARNAVITPSALVRRT